DPDYGQKSQRWLCHGSGRVWPDQTKSGGGFCAPVAVQYCDARANEELKTREYHPGHGGFFLLQSPVDWAAFAARWRRRWVHGPHFLGRRLSGDVLRQAGGRDGFGSIGCRDRRLSPIKSI